jgi:hypothetical protein
MSGLNVFLDAAPAGAVDDQPLIDALRVSPDFWNGLTADKKDTIRKMVINCGPPNKPLDRNVLRNDWFNNSPEFWQSVWPAWSGVNSAGNDCIIREVCNRGKSLNDKFSMLSWEEIREREGYVEHGERMMLTKWERHTGMWELASRKAPAHDTGDEKRTSSQALQMFKRTILMDWDFATSVSGMKVWQAKMEDAARGSLSTWINMMELGLIREGMDYEYERNNRMQKFRMKHDDFIKFWRYTNARTFCLTKTGVGMRMLESDVMKEMVSERQVRPDSLLLCAGAARFVEFLPDNQVFSKAGPTMSPMQPNTFDSEAAMCLNRLGRTKVYQIPVDEGLPFSSNLSDEKTDPMQHRKYCSQYIPMCALLYGEQNASKYTTSKRNVEVIDAMSNGWATVEMRAAFDNSTLFHKHQPNKLTPHGPRLLAMLCRHAIGVNGIEYQTRDPKSSLYESSSRPRSFGDDDDDQNDPEHDGEEDGTMGLLNEEERRRVLKERSIRAVFPDKDSDYAFVPDVDDFSDSQLQKLVETGRLSTVDKLTKGINAYNLFVSQKALSTFHKQLLANEPALLELTRRAVRDMDTDQNEESFQIRRQMEQQVELQKQRISSAAPLRSSLPEDNVFASSPSSVGFAAVNKPSRTYGHGVSGYRQGAAAAAAAVHPVRTLRKEQMLGQDSFSAAGPRAVNQIVNTLFNFISSDLVSSGSLRPDQSVNVLENFASKVALAPSVESRTLLQALEASYDALQQRNSDVDAAIEYGLVILKKAPGVKNLWTNGVELKHAFAANLLVYTAQRFAINVVQENGSYAPLSAIPSYTEVIRSVRGDSDAAFIKAADFETDSVDTGDLDVSQDADRKRSILIALHMKLKDAIGAFTALEKTLLATAEESGGASPRALARFSLHCARLRNVRNSGSDDRESDVDVDGIKELLVGSSLEGSVSATFDRYVSDIATVIAEPTQILSDSILSAFGETGRTGLLVASETHVGFLAKLAAVSREFIQASINGTISNMETKLQVRVAIQQLATVVHGCAKFNDMVANIREASPKEFPTWSQLAKLCQEMCNNPAQHPSVTSKLALYRTAVRGLKKNGSFYPSTATDLIKATRGGASFDLVTKDTNTINKILMRTRLTREFFDWLLDNNFVFPMSFLLFRMAIETMAGNAVFYKKGDDTGYLCLRGAQVAFQEAMHEKQLEVEIMFESNLLVHRPENIMVIPDVFPMSYEGGGGITFNNLDDNPLGFNCNANSNEYADMMSFLVDYNYVPRSNFLPYGGYVDTRLYADADNKRPDEWYPSASIYNEIWKIKQPNRPGANDHMLSSQFYLNPHPKDLWLAFSAATRIYVDDHNNLSSLRMREGEDAVGRKGVKFSSYGGLDMYEGEGTRDTNGM